MTTWLPAICVTIIGLCTMWLATDRAFAHNHDRLLGAAIGFVIGIIIAALFYSLVRFIAWAIGGGV